MGAMGRRRFVFIMVLPFVACKSEEPGPVWSPGTVYATARGANTRGFLDRRGLIHAHSVYSHDACDNEPVKNGERDAACFDDFRRGLCQVKHDFVMLTDHRESFTETPFPDNVLYRPDRGDRLVERDGAGVANIAACPDGSSSLILAGSESGFMPVGLEKHASADVEMRDAIYGSQDASAIETLKSLGAVVLVAHTEDWSLEQLSDLPLDGFEMYNLHANTLRSAGNALELLVRLDQKDPGLPHPDLVLINLLSEDERYLQKWGTVLARGHKRTTTMGTDCHRNTFPQLAQDGERIDSYRRMMGWFSNHLLVREGYDDRGLKEALKAGRLYGVFEVFGFPVGFDFYAQGASIEEMGAEVGLSEGSVLVVKMPAVQELDPAATPPVLTIRLLRAIEDGFEEVAKSSDAELRFTPVVAGAYRAEIRVEPRHLEKHLGDSARTVTKTSFPWIYSNAIYVR